MAAACKISVYL